MNLRQLECDEFNFLEQVQIANLVLTNKKTNKRIICITVITAGLNIARISSGSGTIPIYAFKLLDKYMLERGFTKYQWERQLRNGKMKQVVRRIKLNKH
jgi:hypothetical protein